MREIDQPRAREGGLDGFRRAVIFDFDFTLVDSSAGFIASHEAAARQCGLAAPDSAAVLRTIGTPLPMAFEALYGERQRKEVERYVEVYQAKADEVMTPLTRLLPHANAVLQALWDQSVALAIVSQKLRRRIVEVLEREGLLTFFATLIGAEDLTRLKPDPEGLRLAFARLQAGAAIYVGDTVIDAEAARRAGLPFVAVLTGVTERAEFAAYPSIAVLDDLGPLPDL